MRRIAVIILVVIGALVVLEVMMGFGTVILWKLGIR